MFLPFLQWLLIAFSARLQSIIWSTVFVLLTLVNLSETGLKCGFESQCQCDLLNSPPCLKHNVACGWRKMMLYHCCRDEFLFIWYIYIGHTNTPSQDMKELCTDWWRELALSAPVHVWICKSASEHKCKFSMRFCFLVSLLRCVNL